MIMNESFRCSGLRGNFVSHTHSLITPNPCAFEPLVQEGYICFTHILKIEFLFFFLFLLNWKLNFLISVSHESFGDKGVCDGSTPVVPVKITLLSLVLFLFLFSPVMPRSQRQTQIHNNLNLRNVKHCLKGPGLEIIFKIIL